MTRPCKSTVIKAVILILAWIGSANLAIMFVEREAPTVYEHVTPSDAEVRRGEVATVEYLVHRHKICPVSSKQFLVDSDGSKFVISNYVADRRFNGHVEIISRKFVIPEHAALGPAYFETALEYRCNPIHHLGWPIRLSSPPAPLYILPEAGENN